MRKRILGETSWEKQSLRQKHGVNMKQGLGICEAGKAEAKENLGGCQDMP